MNKKILYIANARMPTEKAHGIQIAKMCEAFANSGREVTLLLPKRKNNIHTDIFDYYNIPKTFGVKKIFCWDVIKLDKVFGRFAFYLQSLSFALSVFIYTKKHNHEYDFVYTRDLLPIFFLSKKRRMVFEAHNFPKIKSKIYTKLLLKVYKIIVITEPLKQKFLDKNKNAEIFVAPDAVDINKFSIKKTKEGCRKELNLPLEKKLILYTGHLYKWKGAHTLLEASNFFKDEILVFVGGTDKDIASFTQKIKTRRFENVLVLGHKKYETIPEYMCAADVLVLPNSGESKISKQYTSPMKLFEYMAANRPIVASDLPSIREILDEKNSVLVEPDNPEALAIGIKIALVGGKSIEDIVEEASKKVKAYTWDKRVENILKFLD